MPVKVAASFPLVLACWPSFSRTRGVGKRGTNDSEKERTGSFYYPQLDGLRSLAFLLVFTGHAGGFVVDQSPQWIRPAVAVYQHILHFNWAGVDLFFCLSAFLITTILLREEAKTGRIHLRHFLFRRALRIWPVYYLAVVVGLLTFPFICTPTFVEFGTEGYWHYTRTTFCWMATFTVNLGISWLLTNTPMNLGPLWSVSMEEQFYVFWGTLLKFVRAVKWRLLIVAVLFCVTLATRAWLQFRHPETHVPFYENTFARLDPILFGILIACCSHYRPGMILVVKRFGFLVFLATLGMFAWLSALPVPTFVAYHFRAFDLTIVDLACAMILLTLLTFRPAAWLFSLKPIVQFGQLTYGMYVLHPFVIQGLNTWILVPRQLVAGLSNVASLINLVIGLPLTFLLAWCVWHLFEGRLYALKSRFAVVKSGFMLDESDERTCAQRGRDAQVRPKLSKT